MTTSCYIRELSGLALFSPFYAGGDVGQGLTLIEPDIQWMPIISFNPLTHTGRVI